MPILPSSRSLVFLAVLALSAACAAQTSELDALLDRAGAEASALVQQVSDVQCTERVQQAKLGKNGKPEYTEEQTYDYFILLQGSDHELLLNESRLPLGHAGGRKKNISLLLTNGFSTLFLVVHPYYRGSFEFQLDGAEAIDGVSMQRVRFRHVAGTRTLMAVAVRGREYPLDLAGTAWIDPATGMIARIDAAIAADMQDVGLRSLTTRVDYAAMRLAGSARAFRFPVAATVDVESLRQHWRNSHRFSNYKHFVVDTSSTVRDAQKDPQ